MIHFLRSSRFEPQVKWAIRGKKGGARALFWVFLWVMQSTHLDPPLSKLRAILHLQKRPHLVYASISLSCKPDKWRSYFRVIPSVFYEVIGVWMLIWVSLAFLTSMNEFTRSFYEVLDIGCPIQQLVVQMVEASEALRINSIWAQVSQLKVWEEKTRLMVQKSC